MVYVTFERNDSHPEGESSMTVGPFEWVQFTYGVLRAGENGEIELAGRTENGLWETSETETWSDIIIG